MGYRELLSQLVPTAFDLLGDLVELGTYISNSVGAYDTTTDLTAVTSVTLTNVKMVLTKQAKDQVEAELMQLNDYKVLIAAALLPGIEPSMNDEIDVLGQRWTVNSINGVPGRSLWIVFIRKM